MKHFVNGFVKRLAHQCGLDVSWYVPLARALNANKIDTVFDIGANEGQFASEVRRDGYTGKIVSFEPLSTAHRALVRNSKRDPLWRVHERCAIGAEDRAININISRNSVSSSILSIFDTHTDACPESVYIGKESAEQIRFDKIFLNYVRPTDRFFLKIDTQGYEKAVLEGAKEALKHATGLQLEVSFFDLYENQPGYRYFLDWAEANRFAFWSLHDGFSNLSLGKTLQADICFFRA